MDKYATTRRKRKEDTHAKAEHGGPAGCVWASREQLQNEYTLPGAFKAYKKKLGL